MKCCSKCKIDQENINFTPAQLKLNKGKCKDCVKIYNKQWRTDNPEKASMSSKKWARNNPEKVRAKSKRWKLNNPEKSKEIQRKSNIKYYNKNKHIISIKAAIKYKNNPEKFKIRNKKWKDKNKLKVLEINTRWKANNPEKVALSVKNWKNNNKDHINSYNNNRYHNNITIRLQKRCSSIVWEVLQENGGSKNGESCLLYFPWTPEQLWAHIEAQFSLLENLDHNGKVWMHKDNQGRYNPKTRKEQDSGTWTWQLDHKIPQSDLPYDNMDHPNFKICWSLENLRPLDSKQNQLDGAKRTRHKKKS